MDSEDDLLNGVQNPKIPFSESSESCRKVVGNFPRSESNSESCPPSESLIWCGFQNIFPNSESSETFRKVVGKFGNPFGNHFGK